MDTHDSIKDYFLFAAPPMLDIANTEPRPKKYKRLRQISEQTKNEGAQPRNESCACGSGLKFKKCCLNK
jgi:uncharacterized protein YecA (UPF0149 family)